MVVKLVILMVGALIFFGREPLWLQAWSQRQQMLDATVMITIKVPASENQLDAEETITAQPEESWHTVKTISYVESDGLGSLVYLQDQPHIITHDHWTVLDKEGGGVKISSGRGQLLAELDLDRFLDLIVHRDGGKMILSAPVELAEWIQGGDIDLPTLQSGANLQPGDEVSVVQNQANGQAGVGIMQAVVEQVKEKQGNTVLRLRGPDGVVVVGGDSGGGVWYQGVLVATMWTTIMLQDTQTGDRRPTTSSIAALLS